MSDQEQSSKKIKTNSIFDRITILKNDNMFINCKVSEEGYGSFYKNPKEIKNLLLESDVLEKKALKLKSTEAVKYFIKAYLILFRAFNLNKNVSSDLFKSLKTLGRKIIFYCDKYNLKEIRDIITYSLYILYHNQLQIYANNAYKSKNLDDHVLVTVNLLNSISIFDSIKNKGFKIVSLDKIEETILELLPADLKD